MMASEFVRDRVLALFGDNKFLCAETVVRVVAEAGGRECADVVRAATGFCSGVSRTRGQCGVVTGAIMGIGLYAGRAEEGEDHEVPYAMVQEFLDRFYDRYGAINCYDLIECDFTVPEDKARYREENLRLECYRMAVFAAETALSILREHGYLAEEADHVKSRLAPCGLVCGKCAAFADGPIRRAAETLRRELGENFAEYAARFEPMNPVFAHYPAFAELLGFLAQGSCTGCREQGCLFQACTIADCARSHGADYCFECLEYPCAAHGLPGPLAEIWRRNNDRMRECGAAAWYRKVKDKPRYP
ncbi:C-GCAxxG-C-C family (seleno)protein [Pseudodesulfovibrio sp.]|uniref:C-GCAxxG-C-C family (seleno)protein n=1 Tax=Pseudodesulfovibrio sp. TaxID=2035812 RepID=UPI003D13E7DA